MKSRGLNASLGAAKRQMDETDATTSADTYERLIGEMDLLIAHTLDRPHWTPRSSHVLEIQQADHYLGPGAFEYRTKLDGWSSVFYIEPAQTNALFDFGTIVFDGFIWDDPDHGPRRLQPLARSSN